MGIIDDMKSKAQDVMNDPEKKEKIEQIAREKGISMDEATSHFMKNNQQ